MEVQLSMVLVVACCLLAAGGLMVWIVLKKETAYLEPVKEELRKEKSWLRRNEYNAAMVKGRQNLELLLRLVAEKNGIQLDNTAKAVANAMELEEREKQRGRRKRIAASVMTHKQFNRWLVDNGYLDRVARWEMNQVRIIGNKAVHENYADKEDAWSQYEYLEDILKTVSEKGQSRAKRQERRREAEEKMAAVSVETAKPEKQPKAVEKSKQKKTSKTEQKLEAKPKKPAKQGKAKQEKANPEKNVVSIERVNVSEAMETAKPAKKRRKRKKKPTSDVLQMTPKAEGKAKSEEQQKAEAKPKQEKMPKTEQKSEAKSERPAKQGKAKQEKAKQENVKQEKAKQENAKQEKANPEKNVVSIERVNVSEATEAFNPVKKRRKRKKKPTSDVVQMTPKAEGKAKPETAKQEKNVVSMELVNAGETAEAPKPAKKRRRRKKPHNSANNPNIQDNQKNQDTQNNPRQCAGGQA